MKQLFSHILTTAACAALATGMACSANASTIITGTYNDAGSSSNYTNASSIPVSTTGDLLFGLAPTSTDYVGTFEASGGNAAPLTDGKTSTDGSLSQPTNAQNSVFDLGRGDVHFLYTLPSASNISSIVVTTGHQDFRVNQAYDILFATVNNPTLTSLSGGAGFNYNPSSGHGGAAQTTLTSSTGLLGSGVTQVEFVIQNSGNDVYRELGVFGAPTTVPEPAQTATFGLGLLAIVGLAFTARRKQRVA